MGRTRKSGQELKRPAPLGLSHSDWLHNRPGIVLTNYKEQTGFIIDIAVPREKNIQDKELKKINKYQSLKIELDQLWKVKIMVIPVVVGALCAIADLLPGWLA